MASRWGTSAVCSGGCAICSANSLSFYNRLSFELPADLEEWFSLELWARGALGVELESGRSTLRLIAYCPDPLPPELQYEGESWRRRGIRRLRRERCKSRDWLAAHREHAVPIEVGGRFLVDAREPQSVPASNGRILLRVPARRAFGTGGHESTRLVLEWLEDLDLHGRSVLDLGSGTGILSLAALRLGAAVALGVDVDPIATFVARETLRLNAVTVALVAGNLSSFSAACFDLALVNILPGEWLDQGDRLASLLAPDARLIVSGVPRGDSEEVVRRLDGLGWTMIERRSDGEWVALKLVRGAR